MPRKKKQELDYTEIQETPLDEIIGEAQPEETAPEEEIKPEEETKPEETPSETSQEEVEEEIEFDPEKFASDLEKRIGESVGKITEETAKRIMEDAMKKAPPAKESGAPDEELISPWDKEKRTPKDYGEIADWAVEKNRILSERAQATKEAKEKETTQAQEDYNKKQVESFNKYTEEQFNDLVEAGKLPAIKNPNNPDDPGVAAMRSLLQIMLEVNLERQKLKKSPIYSLKEIYYEYLPEEEEIKEPVKPVAGADAPISAGRMPAGGEDKEINYTEIHKKPLHQIILEGLRGK